MRPPWIPPWVRELRRRPETLNVSPAWTEDGAVIVSEVRGFRANAVDGIAMTKAVITAEVIRHFRFRRCTAFSCRELLVGIDVFYTDAERSASRCLRRGPIGRRSISPFAAREYVVQPRMR